MHMRSSFQEEYGGGLYRSEGMVYPRIVEN